ncbi:MAG: aromatic-ring-hydroxylating dioxygenase subunit beta [Acidimicrobiales bacterium]
MTAMASVNRSVLPVADFVHHEAALLDARRLEEWLELFAQDGRLWVPGRHDDGDLDPSSQVSIIYDDVRRLRARVNRLLSGKESAQDPPSRTIRAVTNLHVGHNRDGGGGGTDGVVRVDSVQVIYETRGLAQALLILPCRVSYALRPIEDSGGFQIVEKRIDLLEVHRHFDSLSFLL